MTLTKIQRSTQRSHKRTMLTLSTSQALTSPLRSLLISALGLSLSVSASYELSAKPRQPHRSSADPKGTPKNDTPVTLRGVSLKALSSMRSPKLIDVDPIDKQLGLALSGLEALTHMAKMVPEEHAQRALGAQIDSLKASISALQKSLEEGARVDYSVPPPPVLAPQTKLSPTRSERSRPEPMSAVRLSQRWSALEAAPFRDEKMMLIRQIAREEYLTCEQAEVLIKALSFSNDRKDALITLYARLVDPERVDALYQLLDHASHRRKASEEVDRINMHRRQTQGL